MEETQFESVLNEPEIVLEPDLLDAGLAEQNFYNTKYYLSPSALSKFLWRPQAWYNWYVLAQQDDRKETKALIEGSLIHLLILEPHKFKERYCISKDDVVKDKQKQVIDWVWKNNKIGSMSMDGWKKELLHGMFIFDYHQSLKDDKKEGKTGDEKRLDKLITPQAEEYWEFLKNSRGKTLISQETYDFCKAAAEQISKDKIYRAQLGMDGRKGIEVFNELPASCEVPVYEFGFKGIFDNLVIDHEQKVITLNDIKTTSKTLTEFAFDSIEYFNIDLQLAMYLTIIVTNYNELLDKEYSVRVNIIVVNQYGDTYSFPVSDDTLERWIFKLKGKTDEFNWNYKNRNFVKQRVFAEHSFVL